MVNSVELSSDAYHLCLTHALSTEKEEVMGLLLGEVCLLVVSIVVGGGGGPRAITMCCNNNVLQLLF